MEIFINLNEAPTVVHTQDKSFFMGHLPLASFCKRDRQDPSYVAVSSLF